jgi:hypothetical protein
LVKNLFHSHKTECKDTNNFRNRNIYRSFFTDNPCFSGFFMPFNTLVTIIYFYDFNNIINKINTQTRKQLFNKTLIHYKSPLNISETYFL